MRGEMAGLRCPRCHSELKEVTAPARPGYLLILDQCPRCGGIWFDKWELFPVDEEAAKELDTIDKERLWQPVEAKDRSLSCPRCRCSLVHFHDPSLPEDVRIDRCQICEGMWLNRGMLRRYKEYQQERRRKAKGITADELRHLAHSYQEAKNWVAVRDLSGSLASAREEEVSTAEVIRDVVQGVGWVILQTLLRLLL